MFFQILEKRSYFLPNIGKPVFFVCRTRYWGIIFGSEKGLVMHCEFIKGCAFFNEMDSLAIRVLKEVYCEGNPPICARRQVAKAVGRENIPPDLMPNHDFRVHGIIEEVLSRR